MNPPSTTAVERTAMALGVVSRVISAVKRRSLRSYAQLAVSAAGFAVLFIPEKKPK